MSPSVSARLLATQSDARLLELVAQGHERAFEAIVLRYRRPLLRYCQRLGLSDSRAEDVLQHALLRAWQSLERGAEVRDLRAWLYRIVHNTAINALRGNRDSDRALHAPELELTLAEASDSAEASLERRLAVRETLSDVAALPDLQREAILLTALDGRSHEEVALALGVSHGAVRGLLYRARTTLRAAAAALTPGPLLAWASGAVGRMAPTAERVAELSSPGGGGGELGGLLARGVAVAAGATVLAVGAAVGPLRHDAARRSHPRETAAARARARVADAALVPGVPVVSAASPAQTAHASPTDGGAARHATAPSSASKPTSGARTTTPTHTRPNTSPSGSHRAVEHKTPSSSTPSVTPYTPPTAPPPSTGVIATATTTPSTATPPPSTPTAWETPKAEKTPPTGGGGGEHGDDGGEGAKTTQEPASSEPDDGGKTSGSGEGASGKDS